MQEDNVVLLDPARPVRFEPFDQAERPADKRIAYHLRLPSVADEATLHRAVAKAGGRQHGLLRKLQALRDGVTAIFAAADDPESIDVEGRDAILARIESYMEDIRAIRRLTEDGPVAELDEEAKAELVAAAGRLVEHDAALAAIEDEVARGVDAVARIIADDRVYPEVLGAEAARLFVTGWENLDGRPRRTPFGLAEESLRCIPLHHRLQIGAKVEALMRLPETARKN